MLLAAKSAEHGQCAFRQRASLLSVNAGLRLSTTSYCAIRFRASLDLSREKAAQKQSREYCRFVFQKVSQSMLSTENVNTRLQFLILLHALFWTRWLRPVLQRVQTTCLVQILLHSIRCSVHRSSTTSFMHQFAGEFLHRFSFAIAAAVLQQCCCWSPTRFLLKWQNQLLCASACNFEFVSFALIGHELSCFASPVTMHLCACSALWNLLIPRYTARPDDRHRVRSAVMLCPSTASQTDGFTTSLLS